MRHLFFFIFLSFHSFLAAVSVDSTIHAESVILINAKNGRVLWEKNADSASYPASTTKIATVFYALMQKPNGLRDRVVAQKEALACISPYEKRRDNYSKYPSYYNESDGSHVGIKLGEEMSYEDLLYATMLASGNDATNMLAQYVGQGSIDRFMTELNAFTKRLGLTKTNFCNPHGLHHPEHVTTARDMARLAQCAMYHPMFRKLAKSQSYERRATNKQPKAMYTQTNKLMRPGKHFYPYAVGIKTGYHSKAQHALIAAAEKNDRLLICAIMRCKDRPNMWEDAKKLFEAAFNEAVIQKQIVPAGAQSFTKVHDLAVGPVGTYTKDPLVISYYKSEEPTVKCLLAWDSLELPIKAHQKIGEIQLQADNETIKSVPLYAQSDMHAKWTAKLVQHVSQHKIAYLLGGVVMLALLIFMFRRKR